MDVSNTYFLVFFFLGMLLPIPWIVWLHHFDDRRVTIGFGIGMLVAALIYVGFALYEGDGSWILVECFGVVVYGMCALLALKYSMIWLALGWALHPVWDLALHWLGPGAQFVPAWYAIACLSFDLTVALYIVLRASQSRNRKLAVTE